MECDISLVNHENLDAILVLESLYGNEINDNQKQSF